MAPVSSPSACSSSSVGRPCPGGSGRWHRSWNGFQSMWPVKVLQPFRCLPSKNDGVRPGAQALGFRGIVALAAAPVRWNLDDVERISRGRASKAKMGSRAVPHRLNADERKAFEFAKKRGYVVQQANSRRYPLINTYRNYCDALDWLCIRIEQGTTGLTDEVVIDFTPLHLSEPDLSTLRADISKAINSVLATDNGQAPTCEKLHVVDEEGLHTTNQAESRPQDSDEESGLPQLPSEHVKETFLGDGLEAVTESLRFQAPSRNMAKVISQTALDAWRTSSNNKARN